MFRAEYSTSDFCGDVQCEMHVRTLGDESVHAKVNKKSSVNVCLVYLSLRVTDDRFQTVRKIPNKFERVQNSTLRNIDTPGGYFQLFLLTIFTQDIFYLFQ